MIRCLAIDDEELSLDLLEDNIRRVPFLQLVGRCSNAYQAMEIMRREPIDLLFLDIQMPGLKGTEFVQSLVQRPIVIFVTAFKKYALEGFELDVLDYLVKPVLFERFLKAASKAADHHYMRSQLTPVPEQLSDFLFVNVEYNLVKIMVNEITYIEGLKDYLRIHLSSGKAPVVTKLPMKTLSDRLSPFKFARVHKSFIVAVDKINFIRKNRIYIDKEILPVSDFYKDTLFGLITPQKSG
jgi:DNA-binding LytR/AlgR family response regulator